MDPFSNDAALSLFSQKLLLDLFKFDMDGEVIGWGTVDFHHSGFSLLLAAFTVHVSRCLGEEQDSDC